MHVNRLAERIYSPVADRQRGMAVWGDMVRDVWAHRELLLRLAHRDLTVGYRQSLLGIVWAIAIPLLTVALFAYLSSSRLIPIGETPLPYPAYALWGVVLWQLFASTLVAATSSLANAGALVTKIEFPKEVIVFASVVRPLVEFAAKLVLVVAVFLYFGVPVDVAVLKIVPIVLLVVLMAVGFGAVLALGNLVVRDVGNLVGVLATFGVFLAPALYPPPMNEPFSILVVANPFSPLVMASHDVLAGGPVKHADLLLYSAVFAVSGFLFGWRVFRLTIRRITERA